jgi:glycosyltransferase involved in cell wall biosynthesis
MQSISLMFPVYKDEKTVRLVAERAMRFLEREGVDFEIVIVDDGSPDRSGLIADQLAIEYDSIKVVHHTHNLGYGKAIRSGVTACNNSVILMTDGDDQYDIHDFAKLMKHMDKYDLIITFRYRKIYSSKRIFISWIYNKILRVVFRTRFRDVSTGLRLVHKSVLEDLVLESTSPFIGAELAIKAMLKGYRVGEVGIQTFPRAFGQGSSVSTANIIATIKDMIAMHRKVFSFDYDLPSGRSRESAVDERA